MNVYISAIGIANPVNKISQSEAAHFMTEAMALQGQEKRKLQVLYRAAGIQHRYSVLEDYSKAYGYYRFFPNSENLEPFPSTQRRMKVYGEEAANLGASAVEQCFSKLPTLDKSAITHLITVSCTGMHAPGIDIELIRLLNLNSDVRRTAVNFMGCYAAFNALKIASDICAFNAEAKVLIVCVELCTLHFQNKSDEDNLLSNALFGDGAAALIVEAKKRNQLQLKFKKFHCDLAHEGADEMAWKIGDYGFEMRLSSYVPDFIEGGIGKLTASLLANMPLTLDEVDYYAIHPGGKRILEVIERALGMTKDDNRFAYQVLRQYGNMSSPTVVFVLLALWDELCEADVDKYILSFAFGPGLTLESMLLQVSN